MGVISLQIVAKTMNKLEIALVANTKRENKDLAIRKSQTDVRVGKLES